MECERRFRIVRVCKLWMGFRVVKDGIFGMTGMWTVYIGWGGQFLEEVVVCGRVYRLWGRV
jgi:hypothetical protein